MPPPEDQADRGNAARPTFDDRPSQETTGGRKAIRAAIDRVTLSATTIRISLTPGAEAPQVGETLTIPWTPCPSRRRRKIIQGAGTVGSTYRPMPSSARSLLIDALRNGHDWADELVADSKLTVEDLARREGKSERAIRMTLSLAFLSPGLVRAAIEGRLPRGFGLKRLVDLPPLWADQWRALGFQEPVHDGRFLVETRSPATASNLGRL
jgi:hypothetical protein